MLCPGSATVALDGADAIANRAASERDETGECVMAALPGDDRAEIGRVDRSRGLRAGQRNRARLAMAVVKVDIASNQRELV